MSFKDRILKDIDAVFLNLDEFAELHRVEGVQIPVVVDNDQLQTLKKGQILGLVEADILLFGKETDFPEDLEPGRMINYDGRELLITNSGKNMGLVEVALSQNRMS